MAKVAPAPADDAAFDAPRKGSQFHNIEKARRSSVLSENDELAKAIRQIEQKEPLHQVESIQSALRIDTSTCKGRGRWVVEHRYFNFFISSMITLNPIFMGVATDYADDETSGVWFAMESTFGIVFFVELVLRLYINTLRQFFSDGWNIFDFLLVSLACFDTFVMSHISHGNGLNVVGAMRILRLARVARIFRLLRFFKELWLLVIGVLDAMRTLVWAWILIALLIYIFGVFITRTVGVPYKSIDEEVDMYFRDVQWSMFTLFQVMTTEGWADIARAAMRHEPWAWIFFILFLCTTTFAIMNVVVAVIVENTLDQAMNQKEDILKKAEHEKVTSCAKIFEVFRTADVDGNGELTRTEFLQALHRPDVVKYLHEVGIDARQAENLFEILDYDESGSLDAHEFIEGVMKARGEARAKDVLAVQCDLWRSEQKMRKDLQAIRDETDKRMDSIHKVVKKLRTDVGDVKRIVLGSN